MNPLDLQLAQLRQNLAALDAQRENLLNALALCQMNRRATAEDIARLEAQRPPEAPKEPAP